MTLAFKSYSQDKVSIYKSQADSVILSFFEKSVISNLKCTDVAIYGLDSNIIYFSDYQPVRNKKEKISSIVFFYSIFSKTLDYKFNFQITVGRNKKIQNSTLFDDIPNCIAKGIKCYFISKDSAIKIAIRDSILYPKNLSVEFYKRFNEDNYFWIIRGSPDSNKTHKRTAAKRGSTKNEKIISAETGKIIPHSKFYNH